MSFDVTWEQIEKFLYIDKNYSDKPGSVYSQRSRFRGISTWFEGKEWSVENFRLFIDGLKKKGRKNATINKYIGMGRNIDEFIGSKVTKTFKTRKEKLKRIDDVFTPDEIIGMANMFIPHRKYRVFLNQRQKALILFLGFTGCRISEALELKWSEVRGARDRFAVFLDTKNGEDREVPLLNLVCEALDDLPKEGELVFNSARRKSLGSSQCNRELKHRASLYGIKFDVNNHLFRHSFITFALESGMSPIDVMKIVGHKKMETLLRYTNSRLKHYRDELSLLPVLREKMTFKVKGERLKKEIERFFASEKYDINLTSIEGKKLTINVISRKVDS